MLHYILQTIAFQLFFLIVYDVFLKKETFFNWNRVYLLSTAALSIILPFIKVDSFKSVIPEQFVIALPEVLLGEQSIELTGPLSNVNNTTTGFTFSWELLFYVGIVITAVIFIYKLVRLLFLVYKNPTQWKGDLLIVKLINSNAAFSFFHYIFLGEFIKTEDKSTILNHEIVHVKHKHTFDLLFFEVLRIVFWFNPLIYLYQKKMTALHEYTADAKAIELQGKAEYYQNLLSQVFETKNFSFTNTFFKQSLIKNRITMLSKTKSNQILKFKYALLIPMVFGMLLYTSCEKETVLEEEEILATISELNFSVLINSESRNNIDELMAPFKENDEKMNVFLRANPNYVKWVTISPDRISHTIHNTSEQVPDGYNKLEGFKEEDKGLIYYLGFADFKNENSKEKLETESYEEDEVPFAKIDRVPVFPGCEGLDKEAQRKCLSNKIASHVNKNFNLNLGKKLGLSGRQKIHVFFKIDENGNITEIRSRAPHLELEEEAERVIESLPKMKPGKHQGENVIVPYALPIIFQIHD